MNPTYTLIIRLTLGMHKVSRNKQMVFRRYIDFVPKEGMRIKFRNDEGEELDITLINVHYDYAEKAWVEEQQDDTLVEELKERPECNVLPERLQEYIDFHKTFGFDLCPA